MEHRYEQNPRFDALAPFEKNFYVEHQEVAAQTAEQVAAFRAEHQMIMEGKDISRPMPKMLHAAWPASIAKRFQDAGFTTPTPIQAQGWPMALSGRNLIGIAQTGSGKTLSFVLPAFVHILGQPVVSGKLFGRPEESQEPYFYIRTHHFTVFCCVIDRLEPYMCFIGIFEYLSDISQVYFSKVVLMVLLLIDHHFLFYL